MSSSTFTWFLANVTHIKSLQKDENRLKNQATFCLRGNRSIYGGLCSWIPINRIAQRRFYQYYMWLRYICHSSNSWIILFHQTKLNLTVKLSRDPRRVCCLDSGSRLLCWISWFQFRNLIQFQIALVIFTKG